MSASPSVLLLILLLGGGGYNVQRVQLAANAALSKS